MTKHLPLESLTLNRQNKLLLHKKASCCLFLNFDTAIVRGNVEGFERPGEHSQQQRIFCWYLVAPRVMERE